MKELKFSLNGRQAKLKSPKYAKELSTLLSYSHPGARFMPAYNARNEDGERLWDGRTSMVKNDQIPVGLLIGAYKELKDAGFQARIIKWKNRPYVETKKGFLEKSEKYSYQNTACKAILESLSKGGGTVLSATGTGKTKLAAQCFSHIQGQCLFIVDQLNLLYQSQEELAEWLKEEVGIIGHGKWLPKRVTVATIQTLAAHKDKGPFKRFAKTANVIFVDELHKQMSKRISVVLGRLKPQAVIGLTATLQMKRKEIRWKVYSISGPVVFQFDVKEAIAKKVLTKAAVVQVNVPLPDLNYHHYTGHTRKLVKKMAQQLEDDYEPGPNRDYVKQVVCNFNISHRMLPKLVKEALDQDYAVIVLAERIRHIRLLRGALEEFKPRAVYGDIKNTERTKIITRFESGRYNLIIASSVFTKGVNIKRISMIIDVAQRSSKDDAMQKLGRGVRLHEDKTGILYVDVSTTPHKAKAANTRRNTFKKAGIPVKVIDWTNAKEIIKTGKGLLRATK